MNTRRFPTKEGYKLWLDQPEAVVEILDYTPQSEKNVQKSQVQEKCAEKDVLNINEETKEQETREIKLENHFGKPLYVERQSL